MSENPNRNTVIKYRPDIDGLRCVAVLSVVAFHLSPARMSGGFVGVDVFFVISGYLISAIMFSEISQHKFSVVAVYERRARRIFPALFGMLIAVSAVMAFLLLPTEFTDYSKSVIAATFSASNFYFWQHSGYFDSPTSNPLLHTWSLAVEEQFYILFPVFLILVRKFFPRHLKTAVVALFFASLVAAQITLHYDVTAAFYLPYTRAWELLLGTIVALGFFPKLRNTVARNAATIAGIALITWSDFRYTEHTPFPGLAALVPCVGSALIIGAGEAGTSVVGKVLSWRPVVFLGLISYSLYLWHWPLIVLNGLGLSVNLGGLVPHRFAFLLVSQTGIKAVIVVLSVILATLSWRFVERPFRSHPRRIERGPLFALSGAVMALLLLCSTAVIYTHGFRDRFPPRAVQIASFLTPTGASTLGELGDCTITAENQSSVFTNSHCMPATSPEQTYLLVGDSHAGALWDGLKASMPGAQVPLAAVWGCRPAVHAVDGQLCQRMMHFIFEDYLPSHPVRALLLEARWYSDSLGGLDEIAEWSRAHNVKVVLFGPVAEYDAPLPRLLAYSIAWHRPNLAEKHRIAYSPIMDERMREMAENRWHVPYISLYQATCTGDHCFEYADGQKEVPLLTDTDHLSKPGSDFLVHRLSAEGQLDSLNSDAPATQSASVELKTAYLR
jgi:peptidoglycan/LPS O-acetylase OafA/YrhL